MSHSPHPQSLGIRAGLAPVQSGGERIMAIKQKMATAVLVPC